MEKKTKCVFPLGILAFAVLLAAGCGNGSNFEGIQRSCFEL